MPQIVKPQAVEEEAKPLQSWYEGPPDPEWTLARRMLWVTANLPVLAKDSTVQTGGGGSFRAVSHDAVVAAVKPLMVEAGIGMLPDVIEHLHERQEFVKPGGAPGTAHWHQVTMAMKFSNVDDKKDTETIRSCGCSLDRQDKGAGKAMSYAKKYGLLMAFLAQTGEDTDHSNGIGDQGTGAPTPGSHQPAQAATTSAPTPSTNVTAHRLTEGIPDEAWSEIVDCWHTNGVISEKQMKRLYAIAVNEGGWTGDDIKDVVKHHLGVSLSEIPWGDSYNKLVALFQSFGPSGTATRGPEPEPSGGPPQGSGDDSDIPFAWWLVVLPTLLSAALI